MNKKICLAILLSLILISALVVAGPLNVDEGFAELMDWTGLQSYPAACPSGSAITQLDDTVTCTDGWVDINGDTMTSTLAIANDTNITILNLDKTSLGAGNVIDIDNDGTGKGIYIDQNGNGYGLQIDSAATTSTKYGLYLVTSGGAKTSLFYQTANNSALRLLKTATGSGVVMEVENDGTGYGFLANQDGNGVGIYIDSEATSKAGIEVVMANAGYTGIKLTTGIMDANNNIITNIGDSGTDFTDTGGLNLADNLDVNGNVTADNVFILADIFGHTNSSQSVSSAGVWYNVTYTHSNSDPEHNINHTHDDNTNNTFTIVYAGTYRIDYTGRFNDTAASPTGHIFMRVLLDGAEIYGSSDQKDTTKQNAHITIDGFVNVDCNVGSEIKIQFTADVTTVSMEQTSSAYIEHTDSSTVSIIRIR